jgi:hypothetical protein
MIEDERTAIFRRQFVAKSRGQQNPAFLVQLDQDFGPECHGPSPL